MISITRTLSGIKLASSQMFKSAIVPIHDRAGSYIVIKNGGLHFQNTRTRCNEFFDFLTFFLLRRSQVKRSPHGTYSITRNIFSSSVQHPTIDTTFLCEPNIFICSISNVNSSFCVSDGSSKDN